MDELELSMRTKKGQKETESLRQGFETYVEEGIEEEEDPRTGAETLDASYLKEVEGREERREKERKDQLP